MTAAAINPRLAGLRESATLAMNQKSRALRAAGREVALFGFGESPFAVHPKMQAALAAAAGEKSYLPALGLPRLREAVAAHHRRATGLDFSAARIAVAPGSKEAIFHLLYALAGPLILPLPAWVSYAPQARLLGKTTLAVETDYASGYKIDPARLDSVLAQAGAPQSVMILTSPNNPSGQGYAESEWREIAAVCRRRNVFVIADEIYAELTFSDSDSIAPSLAVHCPERVVVTGGLSKSRAAGGWRLGFAAAASPRLDNVFAALAALISETYSCVCAPLQHAAIVAYEDDEIFAYARDCAALLRSVLEWTRGRLTAAGIRCLPAAGGFYLYPDFSPFADRLRARGIDSATALCAVLLDEAGVALLPAEDFGGAADSFAVRLAAVDFDGAALYRAFRQSGDADIAARRATERIPNVAAGCERLRAWLDGLRD